MAMPAICIRKVIASSGRELTAAERLNWCTVVCAWRWAPDDERLTLSAMVYDVRLSLR
jgi:hypothetical protein